MNMWQQFWNDESGAILSAEIVTVGTVAVLGTTVGLHSVATAVNGELTDMARAFRSLDQSYSFKGFSSCRAYTAGSCFTQEPVEKSLQSLCAGAAPTQVVGSDSAVSSDETAAISDESQSLPKAENATPAGDKLQPAVDAKPAAPATE